MKACKVNIDYKFYVHDRCLMVHEWSGSGRDHVQDQLYKITATMLLCSIVVRASDYVL